MALIPMMGLTSCLMALTALVTDQVIRTPKAWADNKVKIIVT